MPSLSSKSKPAATSGAPPKHASLNSSGRKIIRYRGHQHLRQRLILSILSGKSVRIDGIREDEVEVGLKGEWPVSNPCFLGLLTTKTLDLQTTRSRSSDCWKRLPTGRRSRSHTPERPSSSTPVSSPADHTPTRARSPALSVISSRPSSSSVRSGNARSTSASRGSQGKKAKI